MDLDARRRYNALTARDPRFDGVFFVGVTSTDVYCRPICPAKTPRQANCRFFDTPQEAEQAGFRPCLRCRPELAPGSAPVDDAQRIARLIVQRLEEGTLDERAGLEEISDQFELSSRQIRRIVQKELGVPPIQLLLTRRLLLAKQLLTETALPITEVAFASGFSSLRRFNDAFNRRYGMPPTRLRKRATEGTAANVERHTSTLRLSYRPPYDWTGILAFLAARALKGVEHLTDSSYARTVQLGEASGWIRVTQSPKTHALMVEFTHSLTPVLPALLSRVRALFDLDARPDVIAKHLRKDARLAASVKANPGMRVPGAFNGFEMGLRAILGQQVTVKAATTIAGRFVEAFGSPIATPFAELNRLTPAPTRIAAARADDIARHGIISARCRSIIALADAQTSDDLCLDGGGHHNPDDTISRLADLPGIGSWTAQYIAMRALRWPDAFPKEDIAVRHNLGGVTAKEADVMSQRWRPWRSYAVMHVWGMSKRLVPARPRLACVMAIVGLLSASHIARAQSTPPDTVARAEALPQVIPIFPLEVPMLFPGVSRPLHIFEPRYRAMVADALKGDRIIGMTTLKPGYESDYQGRPPVYDIGCAGLITDVEELPGGRFNIELRCVVKFRVTSEDESRAYRLARVEAVPEVADAEEKATLGKLRQRLEELITKGSDSKVSPDTPDEELVNTVAQYIPLGNAERQALLELKSALLRVRALIELIASKTARPRLSV